MKLLVGFIDEHRDEFGVEPICDQLQMAPSTYYAAKHRETAPSKRAVRDAEMTPVIEALWVRNRKVYGAHKLWKAARRDGHGIGRDQVARLMRDLGIEGVSRRRKKVFTTRADPDAVRAPDLVNRQFSAERPDALWVTDITYVPTRSGMGYVCFIVDAYSRRIVGWRVASNMRTDMVLDALEMARRSRTTSPDPSSPPSPRPCAAGVTRSSPTTTPEHPTDPSKPPTCSSNRSSAQAAGSATSTTTGSASCSPAAATPPGRLHQSRASAPADPGWSRRAAIANSPSGPRWHGTGCARCGSTRPTPAGRRHRVGQGCQVRRASSRDLQLGDFRWPNAPRCQPLSVRGISTPGHGSGRAAQFRPEGSRR